ncbi:MAG: MFS transporter [Eubacteriales bacterium]|nr:MFS transporter [Eubacteriales bacterium]
MPHTRRSLRWNNPLTELYNSQQLPQRIRKDLNLLIVSVSFGMVFYMINSGSLMAGFAKALGADDFSYGVLITVPMFSGIMQLFSAWLIEKTRKRKALFVICGIISKLLWLPIALVPYFVPMELEPLRIWVVIVFIALAGCCGSFIDAGLYPWMSGLVPLPIRGRFLGIRSSIYTFTGLISAIIGSLLLDRFTGIEGYSWILGITCFFGVADITCFAFISDVPMEERKDKVSLGWTIKKALHSKEYLFFVLFWTIWSFTGSLYAPYVNMYALGPLHFTISQTTILGQVVSSLAAVFMVQWWGRKLDSHGNRWVIRRVVIVLCASVLVWLFVQPKDTFQVTNLVPYFMYCLSTGLVACGMDVTLQQMLMTSTPQKNRSMFIALYSITTALLGSALGNLTGGWILKQLGDVSFSFLGMGFDRYKLILFAGAALRFAAVFLLLPKLTKGEQEISI